MTTKGIKVGKRVHVECDKPFTGVVTLAADVENIFTKEITNEYHVKADDDGCTYKVRVGLEGCTSITQTN